MSDNMITLGEALKILGVSRSTMYRLAKSGKLPPTRITDRGWYRYDRATVERFKQQCRKPTSTP